MKKLMLIAILSLGLSPIMAQNVKEGVKNPAKIEAKKQQHTETRLNKLNEITGGLSEDQKVKLKAFFETNQAERAKHQGKTKEEVKEAMKAYHKEHKGEFKAIFTKEQLEKIKAFRKENQKQKGNRPSKNQPHGLDAEDLDID